MQDGEPAADFKPIVLEGMALNELSILEDVEHFSQNKAVSIIRKQ
jgi:hypothetical protein